MRRRSVLLAAALLVVTGLVAARAATSSSAPARPEAPIATATAPSASEEPPDAPAVAAPTVTARAPVAPATATPLPSAATAEERAEAAPSRTPASKRTTEDLTAALASTDGFLVVEAADELAHRKATSAIPSLVAMDITKSPRSAPGVIEALGNLASSANPAERQTATDRLLALLAQEKGRRAPESAANILALYTALGQTREPRAATALEGELADPSVTAAAKTVVVDSLIRLRQPTSRAALRTLQQDLSAHPAADAFEAAVRHDLEVAVERALRELP